MPARRHCRDRLRHRMGCRGGPTDREHDKEATQHHGQVSWSIPQEPKEMGALHDPLCLMLSALGTHCGSRTVKGSRACEPGNRSQVLRPSTFEMPGRTQFTEAYR